MQHGLQGRRSSGSSSTRRDPQHASRCCDRVKAHGKPGLQSFEDAEASPGPAASPRPVGDREEPTSTVERGRRVHGGGGAEPLNGRRSPVAARARWSTFASAATKLSPFGGLRQRTCGCTGPGVSRRGRVEGLPGRSESVRLVDYRVRILDSSATVHQLPAVRVVDHAPPTGCHTWGTVGVSTQRGRGELAGSCRPVRIQIENGSPTCQPFGRSASRLSPTHAFFEASRTMSDDLRSNFRHHAEGR